MLPPEAGRNASVSNAIRVAAQLMKRQVVLLMDVEPRQVVNRVGAVNVSVRFHSQDAMLRVMFPVVLHRPEPLGVSTRCDVHVIFARAFPTVFERVRVRRFFHFSLLSRAPLLIRFRSPSEVRVKEAPRRVHFAIVIGGRVKVLRVVRGYQGDFPIS